jgi:hypothetical protein
MPGCAKRSCAAPDVVMIFDSHWFTTGYHLVDGGERYTGTYISDEMPWYLHGVPYDYRGHPQLALQIEAVSRERGGYNRVIAHPDLGRQYATINLVKQLRLEQAKLPVVTASSCQNCDWRHFLRSGEAIGEAIQRSGLRVVLLASGALSHKFNNIDWKPKIRASSTRATSRDPRTSRATRARSNCMRQGRHDRSWSAGTTTTARSPGRPLVRTTCRWSERWVERPAAPRASLCRHTRTHAAPETSTSGSTPPPTWVANLPQASLPTAPARSTHELRVSPSATPGGDAAAPASRGDAS